MARVLGRSLLFAVLLALSLPARADPLLMFLISMAKEIASVPAAKPADALPMLPATYPGTTVEPQILRRLIDDSFLYLSASQRAEVFEALNAELMKPANAAMRAPMIEEFARRALEVRAAQLRLAELSYGQKKLLASEFSQEVRSLPEEELGPLRQALEKGLLPIPADLGRLLLAALD